ncbi:Membrane-associated phospholipid phosphatase [Alkalibacterium sp. AK22]|uniref:phosphatase PAP2 family protein n=1 Tax=Alkalibacterium sp. AK22 TaxID=1229520 RepID=UPI00044A5B09|nr:phosphatase PAP2 family protein [Alkalibacterium sp. AK22]EXJ23999.1 Membrane-associated phospholipid phosphatase [Alkalibacterium sp. AK22]
MAGVSSKKNTKKIKDIEDIKDYMSRKFRKPKNLFVLAVTLTVPFLFLVVMSFYEWGFIGALDETIGLRLHGSQDTLLTRFFIGLTRMGDAWFVALFATFFSLYIWRVRKHARLSIWYFLTVSIGAGGVNQLVKVFFRRPRPTHVEHLIVHGGYSFPSGHAMGAAIAYGALLFLIIRASRTWVPTVVGSLILVPFILLMGISRVYLGLHYPSDIIGGYSLGLAVLSMSIGLYSASLKDKGYKKGQR